MSRGARTVQATYERYTRGIRAIHERYTSALLQLSPSQRERTDSMRRGEIDGGSADSDSERQTNSRFFVVFYREDETKYE